MILYSEIRQRALIAFWNKEYFIRNKWSIVLKMCILFGVNNMLFNLRKEQLI